MILFRDEDRSYLNWVTHHRTGFVLDCLRHPSKAHLVLHRATCAAVKRSASKNTHWTTGKHQKVCALDIDQLAAWAEDQTGQRPTDCPDCLPGQPTETEAHLTRLDRDLLEIVLEVASIHLDEDDGGYSLTAGKVAHCLGKSPGQLASSLARLVADGMLVLPGGAELPELTSPRARLFPTAKALRTIPDYAALSEGQIEAELKKLG